ncbi:hypothetical protein IJ750_05080 [bacterium]|nr:hypothetical protein [bacterium]
MQVSAITLNNGNYSTVSSMPYSSKQVNYLIGDTSFNSLNPFSSRKTAPQEEQEKTIEKINAWKHFCHKQIVGERLNVIA